MKKDDEFDLQSPSYTPGKVLDHVAWELWVPNDQRLAHALEFHPAVICRIRNRLAPIGDRVMVRIMDRTTWTIRYLRELAGMPYIGMIYPPRPRVRTEYRPPRNYHIAKEHILQAMPGTVDELVKKSGYNRGTVEHWMKALRTGDPRTRSSHIIEWHPPNGTGPYIPVHQAGAGEDAILIRRSRNERRLLKQSFDKFKAVYN